jgi:surface antigen
MVSLLGASAATVALLAAASASHADAPGPGVPEKTPRAGGLKAQLTPGDREMNRKCIAKTLNEAPSGKTWSWKNPKTGNGGTVTPTSPRLREGNLVCRNFDETITLADGRSEKISGRACKRPDGSWNVA